jgi:hypothetical protein
VWPSTAQCSIDDEQHHSLDGDRPDHPPAVKIANERNDRQSIKRKDARDEPLANAAEQHGTETQYAYNKEGDDLMQLIDRV